MNVQRAANRLILSLSVVWISGCGSTAPEGNEATQQTATPSQTQAPPSREAQEAFALYSRVRADYDRLVAAHDPAWRTRLELAGGMAELNQLEPRYVTASDQFNGRARQAEASLALAERAGQAGLWDRFRDAINQALAQIHVMRQMVEQIEAEVAQARAASPQAPEEETPGTEDGTAPPEGG